ncbi:unnamed protein product, partial [Ectocarpus fasciculatus]
MTFLVDMIGNAMRSLRSKFRLQNTRDDEEEACNKWLFECATSGTSGIFRESKLELCAMAADPECVEIFDGKAATHLWGRVDSADRASEQAEGAYSSSWLPVGEYGATFANFEVASSQVVLAGTASFLAAGLVMFYLARKASTWRFRQHPAAAMPVGTGVGQHGVNGVDGTPGVRTAEEAGDAVIEPDQVLNNSKVNDIGHKSSSNSNNNNNNNNNNNSNNNKSNSSVCPKPHAVSTVERGDGAVEAGGGEDNHQSGGDGIGEYQKLELATGEELEAGSQMPQRLVSEGEKGKPRRWRMEDMVSAEDDGRGKIIGSGSFCDVIQIVMANGVSIAVKAMTRCRQDMGPQDKFIDREIAILQECNVHPCVIDILGYMRTTERVLIMMPMAMTDMKTVIKVRPFGNLETQHFIRQLLSALEFLHSRNIVQRDVKPHNLLLLPDGSDVGGASGTKLLLADFGLSKKLSDEHGFLTDAVGTKPYMAPELFRSDDADLKYGEKVDVWAVGVVTHELLACVTPFRHGGVTNEPGSAIDATGENGVQEAKGDCATPAGTKTREQLEDDIAYEAEMNNIREGRAIYDSSLVSVECVEFLEQLLQVDDSKRPSAREAADHPWLGGPEQAAAMRASVSAEV